MIVAIGALVVWCAVGVYIWLDVRAHRRLLRHFERLDRERR